MPNEPSETTGSNEQSHSNEQSQSNEKSGPGGGSEVLVELRPDGVALVTLNRPKANALSIGLLGLLAESIWGLTTQKPGALVLWGGERIFAAGADITELSGTGAAARISDAFGTATAALSGIGCPSIAAISGYALGGGLELALGCDFRVAATSARLGQPEILLGIIPGGGGTQRLARLVGPSRAKDLVMTGRQLSAPDALSWGLVDRVVANGEVLGTALELAASLAAGPRIAVAAAKRAIDEGLDTTLEAGLRIERDAFVEVLDTEDARRGIESFVEHGPGKATFVGR
ncbi:MAG: enoyl-CoA hydratase/isomerase family protein [Acidimicrobiales bacterium]